MEISLVDCTGAGKFRRNFTLTIKLSLPPPIRVKEGRAVPFKRKFLNLTIRSVDNYPPHVIS